MPEVRDQLHLCVHQIVFVLQWVPERPIGAAVGASNDFVHMFAHFSVVQIDNARLCGSEVKYSNRLGEHPHSLLPIKFLLQDGGLALEDKNSTTDQTP